MTNEGVKVNQLKISNLDLICDWPVGTSWLPGTLKGSRGWLSFWVELGWSDLHHNIDYIFL